jgi:hypothetical protein
MIAGRETQSVPTNLGDDIFGLNLAGGEGQ